MMLNSWHVRSEIERKFRVCCSGSNSHVQSLMSPAADPVISLSDNEEYVTDFRDPAKFKDVPAKSRAYKNRFLNLVRLSSVTNNAVEAFFKSEIQRRLFVTATLLVLSRVGHFIPLPGFDRRMIPQDYLKFVSGSVDELVDLTTQLKFSFFQLGISPQIMASILMQVLCHLVPSFVKLRKEGLDGLYVYGGFPFALQLWKLWLFQLIPCHILYMQPAISLLPYSHLASNDSQDVVKAFSIINSPFWEHVKEILNPESSVGAEPWVYYSIYAFFVFLFNIFDIVSKKEISDYLNKMGAWIPNFKPGKATIEYLTKIQASTRFWGGLLLTILATTSSILDHWLRHINEGYAIGFLQF
ncbi:hypothetical protein MLD38_026422 [Melastoma candidum]|uniref:Uncharacterized protein n=1 Tax=Melastoma candidum TaxID=119954 RepID=A0ACB9NZX6_9MYRT|nr:hypothetical protein MLD38_026422 [Melastoma candidum]